MILIIAENQRMFDLFKSVQPEPIAKQMSYISQAKHLHGVDFKTNTVICVGDWYTRHDADEVEAVIKRGMSR